MILFVASRGISPSTRRILEGIAFGLVFGSIFPIVSTVIASLVEDITLTFSTALTMHRENPLLQVIDTIPLLLAMAFGVVGRVLARLDGFIEGLEGTVYQRNVVIKRSQDEADAARRAKSALLSQVVAEVHRLLEKSNHHMRQLHRTTLDDKQHATLKGISWTHSRIIYAIWQAEVLSEIDGPPRTVELAPFSPMELCQNLARQFSSMMPAGVDVKVERDQNVPSLITAARARIEQALFALLRCATHVLPEDDLVVTVSQFGAIHGGIPKLHISATN